MRKCTRKMRLNTDSVLEVSMPKQTASNSFVFPRPRLLYCSLTVTQHPQDLLGGIAPHAEPHISGRLQLLRAPRGR